MIKKFFKNLAGTLTEGVTLVDPVSGNPVSDTNPLPVVVKDGITITGPVTVSNEVEVKNDAGNPVPVSGPATNAEMRAAPLPVSGPVTDAQMRATPLPVSGPLSNTQLRSAPVSTITGIQIPEHDEIALSYTGSDLTGVVYKKAGASVATLTLSYANSVLTGVVRS